MGQWVSLVVEPGLIPQWVQCVNLVCPHHIAGIAILQKGVKLYSLTFTNGAIALWYLCKRLVNLGEEQDKLNPSQYQSNLSGLVTCIPPEISIEN